MRTFILLWCVSSAWVAISALVMAADDGPVTEVGVSVISQRPVVFLPSENSAQSAEASGFSPAASGFTQQGDIAVRCQYWLTHLKEIRKRSLQPNDFKDNYSYIRGKRVLVQAHIDAISNCALGVGPRTVHFAEICRLARLVLDEGLPDVLQLSVSTKQGDRWVRIPIQQHTDQQVRHYCQPPVIDPVFASFP